MSQAQARGRRVRPFLRPVLKHGAICDCGLRHVGSKLARILSNCPTQANSGLEWATRDFADVHSSAQIGVWCLNSLPSDESPNVVTSVPLVDKERLFKCRVLIVDDEPIVLETTAAVVRSFGFSVRTAEDGFVALQILREVLPDIMIADLRMPNMSGFELLSIVRRRFPHIPTIAISGEFILANMPLGLLVDHFFQKGGYTPDQLLAKMKELISESPIRPHLGKPDKAPLWIPRKDADYIVVTCPECLRSSSVEDNANAGEIQETECIACGATIRYLVDSSILRLLEDKKKRLPTL